MKHPPLERAVLIRARPDLVFRYFTDSERWARWWGAGSTIDARPGGRVLIRYPNAVEAGGEVIEIVTPERIVFTYGYASGKPIPLGSSRVAIELHPQGAGTRVVLIHHVDDLVIQQQHVQGWRYQMSVFANVVADEVFAGATATVDAWFSAWADPDDGSRKATFTRIASPRVTFRDRHSCLEGIEDLVAHAAATHRFMPGTRLTRSGEVRHCQGVVLAEWTTPMPDGKTGRGTNVFRLSPDGRIEAVTGFASL